MNAYVRYVYKCKCNLKQNKNNVFKSKTEKTAMKMGQSFRRYK